ncbi:MAG: penicillin-binding protein 2 [Patescibacteria group bacterium]|nr:penicillin-binding protein 2 [Patescibacteria group bacterium]
MKQWRLHLILIFICFFAAIIIGRLFQLQVVRYDYYDAMAKGQQNFFVNIAGNRGAIFFNGSDSPVVINKDFFLAFAVSKEIKDKKNVAKKIASLLNLDETTLFEKINKNSSYIILKKKLDETEVAELRKMDISGVYLEKEKHRKYVKQTMASSLLGFTSEDGIGQYGVEGYWDDTLKGKDVSIKRENGARRYLSLLDKNGDEYGADLFLSIDYNIQYQAEKLLKEASSSLSIEGGQIIVMEPSSGRILAMADFPNFDPNQYEKYADKNNLKIFRNEAIQEIFEPGSIFKPLTLAVAINENKITPETVYIDKGYINIGEKTVYNYNKKSYGKKTMTEVLEKSINTGAVWAESQIGHKVFMDYIQRFGFLEQTGIDLQGEEFSSNKELKKGREIGFVTASFGQGIGATPIQMVQAFSAIANNGKMVKPYVVEKIRKNGKITKVEQEISLPVISQRTSSDLTTMLISVVDNGIGNESKIPGYYIAGKTGTAQVPWISLGKNKKGYSDKTWQSFIGYAPAFEPKFLILVKLDNPQTKTAGYSAAPIFKKLAKYIINYYQIPPDYKPIF